MAIRKIVEIDATRCDGCGVCVTACAEGAIQLVDGKARLVKDDYCDGLGACLGECPRDAISVVEREAAAFDERAVEEHLAHLDRPVPPVQGGCPGALARQFAAPMPEGDAPSMLRQWPVQLHLLPPTAPFLRGADLLLAADCAAFAYGDFHRRFLADHALAIACPKLDNTAGYAEKLAAMITDGGIRGITIVMMSVPCCRGLERLARTAMDIAGTTVPVRRVIVGIEGEVAVDV